MALEAYRRALESGKTFDRRTKTVLIGQDRAGKTSLWRWLRGEAFVKDEASSNEIEMISPVKSAGKGAWRNPSQRPEGAQLFTGEGKKTRGEPTGGKGATQERSNDDLASKEIIERNGKVKLTIALTLTSFLTESRYLLTTRVSWG